MQSPLDFSLFAAGAGAFGLGLWLLLVRSENGSRDAARERQL